MKTKTEPWKTSPISPTCERITAQGSAGGVDMVSFCGRPTDLAYPAMGGGWMALCFACGHKHLPRLRAIEDLIRSGEKFA